MDFYTRHIKNNPDWEFAKVYADEGISGTNTKRRDEFNRMVTDALDGKIDLILTKSISRFARNTVDSLTTVRKLKGKGVEVYFEKENIYTLDSKGELLITIMSSLAQEESRSISENVTWGKRRSMEEGKVFLPYKRFLGYEKGEDGMPRIVEAEAKVIRQIYALFLAGQTIRNIAKHLTGQGTLTPSGKANWSVSTIKSILTNEKYKGDALLQKSYTVDFLSKTKKKNNGELHQYYITNSHPAIIPPGTYDLVQSEMKRRQTCQNHIRSSSPFAAKIICGECGGYYGSKVWHSNSKYRKCSWFCNRRYGERQYCDTPHISESELQAAFVEAINRLLGDKERYITQFEELLPLLADTSVLEARLAEWKLMDVEYDDFIRTTEERHTRQVQNQEEYARWFNEMDETCRAAEQQVADIRAEILEQATRKEKIRQFLSGLKKAGDIVTEFDVGLWQATVETVTVQSDKTLLFTFLDGAEISVQSLRMN